MTITPRPANEFDECWSCGESILKGAAYCEIVYFPSTEENIQPGVLHRCHVDCMRKEHPAVNDANLKAVQSVDGWRNQQLEEPTGEFIKVVDTDNRDANTTWLILENGTRVEVNPTELFDNMQENNPTE